MSKISKAVEKIRENEILHSEEIVKNFMGGDSYKLNPIDTLKIIAASSFFGEASYYRKDVKDGRYSWEEKFSDSFIKENFSEYGGKTTDFINDTYLRLQASLSYGGARNWKEFRKNVKAVKRSQAGILAAKTHLDVLFDK